MRRLRIDWPEAWYPVAGGAVWLRPADVLAVVPGDGPDACARVAAGRLVRAEAHGSAWRAVLTPGPRRRTAGALLAEVVGGTDPAVRLSRLGQEADGATWPWLADELGAWCAGGPGGAQGPRLDRLWPRVAAACPPLRGAALRGLADGLRAHGGGPLPADLAARLAADAATGRVLCAGPGPAARARAAAGGGWGCAC